MPTLEQITDPVFSTDSNKSMHREFVPFNEELTAEMFADEINSGRMSVEDAYNNFWSYKEDADFWDLPKDREWRALLPNWRNIIKFMFARLSDTNSELLANKISSYALEIRDSDNDNYKFNPFMDDLNKLKTYSNSIRKIKNPADLIEYVTEVRHLDDSIKDSPETIKKRIARLKEKYNQASEKEITEETITVEEIIRKVMEKPDEKEKVYKSLISHVITGCSLEFLYVVFKLNKQDKSFVEITRNDLYEMLSSPDISDRLVPKCIFDTQFEYEGHWDQGYVDKLIDLLKDELEGIRAYSARILGEMYDKDNNLKNQIINPLSVLLDDNSEIVRTHCMTSFCKLGYEGEKMINNLYMGSKGNLNFFNKDLCSSLENAASLSRENAVKILYDLKKIHGFQASLFETLTEIHNYSKPKGYIAPDIEAKLKCQH
jgi:hypothetical protein